MLSKELFDRLLSMIFPARCVFCGAVVDYDTAWCGCEIHEKIHRRWLSGGIPCYSAFEYDEKSPAGELILRFKTERDLRTSRLIAAKIATTLPKGIKLDLLVPVPARDGERGRDHAYKIAEELGAILDLPLCCEALGRRESSREQHSLRGKERAENAEKSYYAKKHTLKGKRVLIVDDVVTTGATLAACARAARELGAIVIAAGAFAATAKKRH